MIQPFARLCDLLVGETTSLFAAQGYSVTCSGPELPSSGEMIVGVIGLSGNAMRGALVLAAHPAVWRHLVPRALGAVSLEDSLLCDMVGETCNMVLGRFRNALLRRGTSVTCAIPSAFRGSDMDFPVHSGRRSAWRAFETSHGPMHLRFDVTLATDFVLGEEECLEAIHPIEDELVLF